MAFEVVDFLPLGDIVDLDLSVAVAKGNFVFVAEGDGADVVVDLVGFVEPADI